MVALPRFWHNGGDAGAPLTRREPTFLSTTLDTQRPTAYLDGMRGLAAFCVVVEHYAAPFQSDLYYAFGGTETPHFLQLPIIRLCYSGSPMVCIFFVISGVALSLRPARLIKQRDWDGLYRGLGSAIFRRGTRLFGPALMGSFTMMLGAHLHLYDVQSDIKYEGPPDLEEYFWLRQSRHIPGFWNQLGDWLGFVSRSVLTPNSWRGTGTGKRTIAGLDRMEYGSQFWTIPVEFWSSILLFATIIASARVRRKFRLSLFALLACLSLWLDRWDFGLFLYGSLLVDVSDLGTKAGERRKSRHCIMEVFWVFVFCFGLFFASAPEQGIGTTPAFTWLFWINGDPRIWQSLGAAQIVTAICNATVLQRIFSIRCVLYLGQISYALYIVHFAILSSIGWRLVPIIWNVTGRDTSRQYNVGFVLAFLLLLPVFFWVADIFYRLVDRPCTYFAKQLEDYLNIPDEEMSETADENESRIENRVDV